MSRSLRIPCSGRFSPTLLTIPSGHGERVSEIRLSVKKDDPDLFLIYEDNGTGVLSDEKEKIFLKGFGKHTGLGMFLIREILSITGITIRETGTWQQGARSDIRVPPRKNSGSRNRQIQFFRCTAKERKILQWSGFKIGFSCQQIPGNVKITFPKLS